MSPQAFECEAHWRALSQEVITGIRERRVQHPKATRREVDAAVDERLAQMRTRMLQDLALASQVAATVPESLRDLERRQPMITYARVQTQG